MTTLSILPVRHHADLLAIYPNQYEPQDCFIELDLSSGRMSAQTNPEIGNAVPVDVWHGLVRRYYVPGPPTPAAANALMEDISSHAQIILDHAEVIWDGSNNVVRTHGCDCPIAVSERAIEAAIDSISEEDYISWAEAGDWYANADRAMDEYVARVQAGESIEDVAAAIEREIDDRFQNDPSECWVIVGIDAYLRMAVANANGQKEEL
jgi:hypothetical protein